MSIYINDGTPTTHWMGISHDYLLRLCAHATDKEAVAMSTAAALLATGDCTVDDWRAAHRAVLAVEGRLCAAWEAEHGEPRRDRYGQLYGGCHPGLFAVTYPPLARNGSGCERPNLLKGER